MILASFASVPNANAATPASAQTASAQSASAQSVALPSVNGSHTITLVTGDKVTLTANDSGDFDITTEPSVRQDGVRPVLAVKRGPDGVYVIPSDAALDVLTGRLDRELFNVEYLAANGYADNQSGQVPVIVQYPQVRGFAAAAKAADALPASTPSVDLPSVHGAALKVSKAQAGTFWSSVRGSRATLDAGLAKVWLDRKVKVNLDESVPLVGAPQAWAAGHDGRGVDVAVLDTGIDDTHPDLKDKVAASKSFVPGVTSVKDGHGHGTHVASTIVGSGAASDGRRKGVAPGARLLVGKVLDDTGYGDFSWIMAGMEWAAHHARIVSMSLGGPVTDGSDIVTQSVNQLTAETGALFVIAAGNSGQPETIATPGTAEAALTVGATDKSDQLAWFSSQGPRLDGMLKPDIAAPGAGIVAARAAGTVPGPIVDGVYTQLNGTSMATPHVAGAAAILAQTHPDWTAARLKSALMSTAKDVGLTVYQQGAGRLDVARADRQQVVATTPNLDFGLVPITGQTLPIDKQVTYANGSDKPVTLTVATTLHAPGGETVSGALRGDTTVTVPAGGTASATVTLDANDLARGNYSGTVVATDEASGTRVTTPVGLVRSPPMATLSVRTLDRNGNLAYPLAIDIIDVTKGGKGGIAQAYTPEVGVINAVVPEGTYSVSEIVGWVDGDSLQNYAYLTNPQFTVRGDTTITLDARKVKRVEFRTPRESKPLDSAPDLVLQRTTEDGARYSLSMPLDMFRDAWVRLGATPTARVTKGRFHFGTHWVLGTAKVELKVVGDRQRTLHPTTLASFGDIQGNQSPGYVPVTGTRDLPLVDVRHGLPEEVAGMDLHGKLALMESRGCGLPIDDIIAVREAGAAAIVAFPPTGMGCRIPMEIAQPWFEPPKPVNIAHVAVSTAEGAWLRKQLTRGAVTLRLSGTPQTSYIYTLAPYEEGRIPSSLRYRYTDGQLARIDMVPHSTESRSYGFVDSTALRDSTEGIGGTDIVRLPEDAATNLRVYAGPVSDRIVHKRNLIQYDASQAGTRNLGSHEKIEVFDRPVRRTEQWFTTPVTPGARRLSRATERFFTSDPVASRGIDVSCTFCRTDDRLDTLFSMWTEGQRASYPSTAEEHILKWEFHLYNGDEEIPRNPGIPSMTYTLPPEKNTYRLTGRSARTDVTWTFTSQRPTRDTIPQGHGCRLRSTFQTGTCRQEPFVLVGYDLGGSLAADNTVAAGRHTFRVTAYHPAAAVRMPRIAGLKLWYSTDDGAHWAPAALRRHGDGDYLATAVYPALSATSGAVSLKVEAWDADGNRIEQTTKRAFDLR
ncbi:S8 family serine peptidase [Plantactinospora sp. B6F1]|uniref:S8 family peptidase n=1 Tax=Plantactinospora sp. B6F1 TaxID=3158971 RepID=UPI0032D8D43B